MCEREKNGEKEVDARERERIEDKVGPHTYVSDLKWLGAHARGRDRLGIRPVCRL